MTASITPPRWESTADAANYDALLVALGQARRVGPERLAAFWPMVGTAYRGDLLLVGRAVNGWIDAVDVHELGDPEARGALLAAARKTSEGHDDDPMGWVVGAWGRRGGYSTSRSQFWRTARRVLAGVDRASAEDPWWPSRLAWTNLCKLAPYAGGNPGGALLRVQRALAPTLLRREIEELAPKLVLVLAGRWWFEPFAEALGLDVHWQDGLVGGVADDGQQRWVIAPHPQGRPEGAMSEKVLEAFSANGASPFTAASGVRGYEGPGSRSIGGSSAKHMTDPTGTRTSVRLTPTSLRSGRPRWTGWETDHAAQRTSPRCRGQTAGRWCRQRCAFPSVRTNLRPFRGHFQAISYTLLAPLGDVVT
jgi:hypothetical protein